MKQAATSLKASHKLSLNGQTAVYTLSLDCNNAIDSIILHGDIPVEILSKQIGDDFQVTSLPKKGNRLSETNEKMKSFDNMSMIKVNSEDKKKVLV